MRQQPQADRPGAHNYISAQNSFPPLAGNMWRSGPAEPGYGATGRLGWAASLMPMMEQQAPPPARANYSFGADQVQNYQTVCRARVATFICPSESVSQGPWLASSWMNYCASAGGPASMATWSGIIIPMREEMGVIEARTNYHSKCGTIGLEGVTDGTSNTVAFSERLVGIGPGDKTITRGSPDAKRVTFGPVPTVTGDTGGAAQASRSSRPAAARPLPPPPPGKRTTPGSPARSGRSSHANTLRFNGYTHVNTPNGISCMAENYPPGQAIDAITVGSNHSGGVNACMADGSVRFFKDTVAIPTWWAVGTRGGGEIVSG